MGEKQIKVETYNLRTRNGKHIRKATMVIFPDGIVIRFIEKMGKKEAIRQAQRQREINTRHSEKMSLMASFEKESLV